MLRLKKKTLKSFSFYSIITFQCLSLYVLSLFLSLLIGYSHCAVADFVLKADYVDV